MNLKFDKVNIIGFHHTNNHPKETTIWTFEQEKSLQARRQRLIEKDWKFHQHCKLCKTPFKSKEIEIFCNSCHFSPEAKKICPHKRVTYGEYSGGYCFNCGDNIGF